MLGSANWAEFSEGATYSREPPEKVTLPELAMVVPIIVPRLDEAGVENVTEPMRWELCP